MLGFLIRVGSRVCYTFAELSHQGELTSIRFHSTTTLYAFGNGSLNALAFSETAAKASSSALQWQIGAANGDPPFNTIGYQPVLGVGLHTRARQDGSSSLAAGGQQSYTIPKYACVEPWGCLVSAAAFSGRSSLTDGLLVYMCMPCKRTAFLGAESVLQDSLCLLSAYSPVIWQFPGFSRSDCDHLQQLIDVTLHLCFHPR